MTATDDEGNTSTKTFKITVQRDTDHDGTPDVTDTDDDGDGYPDTEEAARGTDPKDPTSKPTTSITPISDQTVVEGNPISSVTVTVDNPNTTVTVSNLPNGVTYNPATKTISGTPSITDWTPTEETREITVTVTATDTAGNPTTSTFKITVQRDTDHDGNPDITDLDDDGDGIADTVEQAAGSNPKDPNSRPAAIISPVDPTTVDNQIQTVIDENPITPILIGPGNIDSTVSVDTSKLPNGVTYNPGTLTISGTPDVTNWGPTEETRRFEIPVVVTNPDGSKVTKIAEITVQRDTDHDGTPDVTDTDDDGDGYPDTEEAARGTDPKDPTSKPTTSITPISNQTVVEGNPISSVTVTVDNPNTTVTVSNLPNGVTYNPATKTISGTPSITDWTPTEETREITVTVTATDTAGNPTTSTFKITVQRDTDHDGDPDITDTDDDGDGYPDTEEAARGTDPKDPTSKPTTSITPISNQTVVEGNPISSVTVTVDNPNTTVTVSNLPNGVTYNPVTKTISGTPSITDWTPTEETREITVTVTATDTAGNPTTSTFKITVQRDTDHDGDPDITDTDDDGDGYTDVDEVAHGTDPKDPTSVPTTTPQTTISNPNQTVIDEQPITNIVITPGDPATVITVDTSKLPNGVTYNPATKTISGTPDVTDWTPTEETRTFEIPVTVQNPDGTTANKKIKITVQRDTDGDGTPDVTDTDDDGDGIPDTVEQAAGSDPKDANSRPAAVITPVAQPTINNPIQTVIDGNPITNIVITPGDPASVVTVDTPNLPNGVTYDPSTNTISGTPSITDWTPTEETRNFQVTVTVQNPDGTTVTRTIDVTVQRDTDGDGDPDITDLDDDNDGYTDVEEIANGTDPKDANSRPASAPQPSSPSTPSAGGSSSTVQRTAQTSDATNLFGYATSMTFFATLLLILAFIRKEQSAK